MKKKSDKSKKVPVKQKIVRREIITDQSDPRMIKFREDQGEFKPGYPRKTVRLEITEYESGPDDLKLTTKVGYYEGEPPPEYKEFFRRLFQKALEEAWEKQEREQWIQELKIEIRNCSRKDKKAVIELWKTCKLVKPWDDPKAEFNRNVDKNLDLFLIGVISSEVVATVIGRCDENRGQIEYLAVHPSFRRRGIGRQLTKMVEEKLFEKGCSQVSLLVPEDYREAIDFYGRIGYRSKNLLYMEKQLKKDY